MAKKEAKLSEEELAAQLGYAAIFFKSVPELKAMLKLAVKEGWTADKFKGRLMATTWYRTHTEQQRKWAELEARDPAEAASQTATQIAKLKDMFSQAGIAIDPARLNAMAKSTLAYGTDETELQDMLAAEFTYVQGGTSGGVAATETQINGLARDYGVSVSAGQMQDWIAGVVSGSYTTKTLEDYIRDSARSKYLGFQKQIDAGMTVRDIAAPYLSSYSKILETSPDNVDLDDPLIQQALQGRPNQQGDVEFQSVYDFEKTLKKDPRWYKTGNAHDQMTNVAMAIGRDFGLVG